MQTYDFIVVGGGSAGCIVAAELAQRTTLSVLLLEAGQRAEENPETLTADGYKYAFANDSLMYERFTEKQTSGGKRRWFAGTGKGMGGSGSINGMVYTRGDVLDYAEWPEGWRWNDLVPAFEAIEARLKVKPRPATEFTEACIIAAEAAGFARKKNLNDGALKGFLGYEHMGYDGDARRSSYTSFLAGERSPNLHIETRASTEKITFEGSRAVGVTYRVDGEKKLARATQEIVLCAGALETPKLLLLSGIGPRQQLEALGIEVISDQPEVGENLHDHPNITMFHLAKKSPDCSYPQLYGFHRANPSSPLPAEQADTCYVFYTGRSSLHQATLRMLPAILLPLWLYNLSFLKKAMRWVADKVMRFPLMARYILNLWGVVVILGKPMSRGSLRLRSADPKTPASIDPKYFSDPRDMDAMLAAVRIGRRIAAGLAAWGNFEIGPGKRKTSDNAIAKWIRAGAMTTYHFAGTCRMGTDKAAPVDTDLHVRGVTGLRVADASIVPSVPVSAMNAPSMLIGYRAAQSILQNLSSREKRSA